jgi:hypothetical protein
MENNSIFNDNKTNGSISSTMYSFYLPLNIWFNYFGSRKFQEISYLVYILVCFIGALLNMISYRIFRKSHFDLTIHEYLRMYTVTSALICVFLSTRFISCSRRFFSFSNSEFAVRYLGNFYIPFTYTLNLFQSCFDILLSFDRIHVLTDRFKFYKNLKPKKVVLFLFAFSCFASIYNWLYFSYQKMYIPIGENEFYLIHFLVMSKFVNSYVVYVTNVITSILPAVVEVPLNIWTIKLLHSYLKKGKNVQLKDENERTNIIDVNQLHKMESFDLRVKKLEIKITVLVIVLSCVSIL